MYFNHKSLTIFNVYWHTFIILDRSLTKKQRNRMVSGGHSDDNCEIAQVWNTLIHQLSLSGWIPHLSQGNDTTIAYTSSNVSQWHCAPWQPVSLFLSKPRLHAVLTYQCFLTYLSKAPVFTHVSQRAGLSCSHHEDMFPILPAVCCALRQ